MVIHLMICYLLFLENGPSNFAHFWILAQTMYYSDPLDESDLVPTSEFRPVNHLTTTGINVELFVNEKSTNPTKNHHCSKCQKSFATSQVLKSHMLFNHTG